MMRTILATIVLTAMTTQMVHAQEKAGEETAPATTTIRVDADDSAKLAERLRGAGVPEAQIEELVQRVRALRDGSSAAQVGPEKGTELPFRDQAEALAGLFPDGLIDIEGNPVSMEVLKDKIVGIYFSAHWCGPCRRFTPSLVEFRNRHQSDFEVVFVSSDRSAEKMKAYRESAKMPWPAVKFGSPAVRTLKDRFAVRGIPSLVWINADGSLYARNGRALVSRGKADVAAIRAAALSAKVPAEPAE